MREEAGFSLLEITISIAVLALLSGFIVKMFVTSIHLNQRAYNHDMGLSEAIRAIETIKGEQLPSELQTITHYYNDHWHLITIESEFLWAHVGEIRYVLIVESEEDESHVSEVYREFDLSGNYVVCSNEAKMLRLEASVFELKTRESSEEHDMYELIVRLSTSKYQHSG
jgi:prepilin-type N-terminal cleavage/methylation domain-containing protein